MFHKLILAGHLGRDPEMRYTPAGTPVANLSVASNRQYSVDGQTVRETIWFRVSVWGRQAEVCHEYLKKGRSVLIEGRLVPNRENGGPRLWTGQDGQARASFEVNAETVRFLDGKPAEEETDGETSPIVEADAEPMVA